MIQWIWIDLFEIDWHFSNNFNLQVRLNDLYKSEQFFLLDLGNCYYYGNYGFYEHWSIVPVKNGDEFIINMTDRWKIVKKVNTMQKVDIVGIEIFSRLHSQFWTQSSRKYTTLFWTVYFMINTHNAINLNSSTKSEVIHVNVYSKTKKKNPFTFFPSVWDLRSMIPFLGPVFKS